MEPSSPFASVVRVRSRRSPEPPHPPVKRPPRHSPFVPRATKPIVCFRQRRFRPSSAQAALAGPCLLNPCSSPCLQSCEVRSGVAPAALWDLQDLERTPSAIQGVHPSKPPALSGCAHSEF